jgi:hypothetical protein
MHDSLATDGYHRIVLRSGDNGTGEEFPAGMLRISYNLVPFTLNAKGILYFYAKIMEKSP